MTNKVLTVVGARPQFIKLAPVSRQMDQFGLKEIVVHTGQHYDDRMSNIFFEELCLEEPKYNLAVGSGNHGEQTAKMLQGIEAILLKEKPQLLLVYGDTNSTLSAALAASKLHIPIAHVEAGLRSFDKSMPEEVNRVLTDHISDLLFTPTIKATNQLLLENISREKIHEVGDVMFDAMLWSQENSHENTILNTLDLQEKHYILVTVHRQSNTEDVRSINIIINTLNKLSKEYKIVFPLHPRTRHFLEKHSLLQSFESSILLLEPVSYRQMAQLEKQAALVMTDSGGVQKEAFFCGTPCITLREQTEWVELVELGWNQVIPPENVETLYHGVINMIKVKREEQSKPYGDGKAAKKICGTIKDFLTIKNNVKQGEGTACAV